MSHVAGTVTVTSIPLQPRLGRDRELLLPSSANRDNTISFSIAEKAETGQSALLGGGSLSTIQALALIEALTALVRDSMEQG